MNDRKLFKALKFVPGKNPIEVYLPCDINMIAKEVSEGSMYACEPMSFEIEPYVHVLYNEDAPIIGLEPNRKVSNTIIAGTFLIVGCDENYNLCSLPKRTLYKYGLKYYKPEWYSDNELIDNFFERYIDICPSY